MVRLRVLGPMAAERDGGELELGGPKQRTVLALLLTGDGHRLDADALIDAMWGEEPPASARSSLQAYVSRLRSSLGDDVIVWDGTGYRLALPDDAVDAWRFVAEAERGRTLLADEPQRAEAVLRGALELWRGPAFSGLDGPLRLDQEARRLDERRLGALVDHARARLASGDAASVAGELEGRTREHPTHEGLRELHALALYRSGRQAEALDVIDETRRLLRDELGVDLSPRLQELQRRLLDQDPTLEGPAARPADTELPRGTVTFVLTDVEEAVRLHHRAGDRFGELLDRYLAIVRAAWREHGGREFGLDDDRARVAFARADDAVRACVAAQRRLEDEAWPDGLEVRVRIGVHTGIASPDGGRYVAMALHEAAGVVAAAHGRQVLLSGRTVAALESDVGRVERLGMFRIRGAGEPVELYSHLDAPGGDETRAVRAIPAEGHNLARPPTETLGRNDLVSAVLGDLVPGAVVTLLGPGGVGKTRAVTEVGIRAAERWRDGAWFVDLSPVTGAARVGESIADAVGAPSEATPSRLDDAVAHLRSRRAVVILDNCEQVIEAVREAVERLRERCPDLAIMVTSRERLHVPGERVRAVEPLGLPPGDAPTADELVASPAGALFVTRARDVRPDFEVDRATAPVVAEICRRLDGLPLPLELAAAQVSVQTPDEVLASLSRRPEALRRRDAGVEERHGSVEELVAWSVRLLDADRQTAFRRLGVLAGSFWLETAATAISSVGDLSAEESSLLVWDLVDRSLVVADPTANGTRYRMLQIIRDHAVGLLRRSGEAGQVAAAVTRTLLERTGPDHPPGPVWMADVELELTNLRGLVPEVAAADPRLGLRAAASIGIYHDHAHRFRSGADEVAGFATLLVEPCAERVGLLAKLADLHLRSGDVEAARPVIEEALLLQADHGPPPWDEAAVDRARGEAARRSGDFESAITIAREALERDLGDGARRRMLNLLGTATGALGRLEESRWALEEELAASVRSDLPDRVALSQANLAETQLRLGDVGDAARTQRACLEMAVALGSPMLIAYSLIVAARVSPKPDHAASAVALLSHADALLADIGLDLYEDDRLACEQVRESARTALGDHGYDEADARGRSIPTGGAVEEAERLLGAAAEPRDGS